MTGSIVVMQHPSVRNLWPDTMNVYVYRHKHNYILCSMFTITKAQLHVSAINVGHLQVVTIYIYTI